MPKTTKSGDPRKGELPQTLQRSDALAQRTFAEAYDSAMDQYRDEERAHRTAWAALKHTHEKVGDRWRPKAESGPSDERAAGGRGEGGSTAGGVDANASKEHLLDLARELDIRGRSTMRKDELVEALRRESERRTKESAGD
ncbi:ChaB family protein [Brevibacterium album]|uniref:ChaB family protein n=1 Tax=Brevibacterium album TaxID=417948 RepID=UPI0004186FCC|nr:ChaB family protein [Brevibacterium album]